MAKKESSIWLISSENQCIKYPIQIASWGMRKKAEYKLTKMIWKRVTSKSLENLTLIPFPPLPVKWEHSFPVLSMNTFPSFLIEQRQSG